MILENLSKIFETDMKYHSLKECILDLESDQHLIRIDQEIDADLEVAYIARRVFQNKGPALYFSQVKNCKFPMVCNLFGTKERLHFIFRDTLTSIQKLIKLKTHPAVILKNPFAYLNTLSTLWHSLPKCVHHASVLKNKITIQDLPQLRSWPKDGGAFITLPQVYTESATCPGWIHSNLGMYRIQLSGGQYVPNQEVGLHYQIHRGIGIHHAEALQKNMPFHVNIFIGGPPAMNIAAIMPLPEGMTELAFAGALNGSRIRYSKTHYPLPIFGDADFFITGTVYPDKKLPEGPFGDHLGYYSLKHDFPVLKITGVYHRDGAIWPFTSVGRPPQEDTMFGELIHEITGPIIPQVIPGIKAIHAVDRAGVHPLLLAIGSERYVPYAEERIPQELLTLANALLGQGQLSLAKWLLIAAHEDNPSLDIYNIPSFFAHILERVDWKRDLHFQTATTMDTLDYSGTGLNQGSKVVIASAGIKKRNLSSNIPSGLKLPDGFKYPQIILPGVLIIQAPDFIQCNTQQLIQNFCEFYTTEYLINQFPMIIIVNDSEFAAKNIDNFLWVTFTRSNPAQDIQGIGAFIQDKHWGCTGSLVIDARIKPQHAPILEDDPQIIKKVENLAKVGGPLHKII